MLPLLLWTVAMATCCPLIVNSYSMELSPSSAMRKSRVSRMQRGMLPSGMYAVLRSDFLVTKNTVCSLASTKF